MQRALERNRPDPADPVGVLAAVGGLEHAALVGFLLGAAAAPGAGAAGRRHLGRGRARRARPAPDVDRLPGGRPPVHRARCGPALQVLGLQPVLDLRMRLGEGSGAALALPVLQAAARVLEQVATFDGAGVARKDHDGS